MKWVLVILTFTGGSETPKRTVDACLDALRHTRISPVRQAYCMSNDGDAFFYMKNGKRTARIQ
jgi:hypothetical protein